MFENKRNRRVFDYIEYFPVSTDEGVGADKQTAGSGASINHCLDGWGGTDGPNVFSLSFWNNPFAFETGFSSIDIPTYLSLWLEVGRILQINRRHGVKCQIPIGRSTCFNYRYAWAQKLIIQTEQNEMASALAGVAEHYNQNVYCWSALIVTLETPKH